MKLVAITFGSEGDHRPVIALCRGLKEAGHQVSLLGDRAAKKIADDANVSFVALEGDMAATVGPGGPLHKLMNEHVSPRQVAKAAADLTNAQTASWMQSLVDCTADCDAILFSGFASYVGLSVAEYRDVPAIGLGLFPVTPTKEFPFSMLPPMALPGWLNVISARLMMNMMWKMFRDEINQARKLICGQAPRKRAWSDYATVYGISRHIIPQPEDWPDNQIITGAWYTYDADWQPDERLLEFIYEGEKPIYVGFGSMSGFDYSRMLNTVIAGVGERRVLFSPGWSEMPHDELPDNFFVLQSAPHDWVFSHVSLAIHHGGAGTCHSAVQAGIPSVVIPFAGDQFFWAGRLNRIGVAPPYVTSIKLNSERLRELICLAEQDDIKARSRSLGECVRQETGIANAVDHIERILA